MHIFNNSTFIYVIGRSTGHLTPMSKRRPPSVARSITSNRSRRIRCRTSSMEDNRLKTVDRIGQSERQLLSERQSQTSSSAEEEEVEKSEVSDETEDESEESRDSYSSDERDNEEDAKCKNIEAKDQENG